MHVPPWNCGVSAMCRYVDDPGRMRAAEKAADLAMSQLVEVRLTLAVAVVQRHHVRVDARVCYLHLPKLCMVDATPL